MAVRVGIDQFFNLDEAKRQQGEVVKLIEDYISKANSIKPIVVGLQGADKTGDIIKGTQALNNAITESNQILAEATAIKLKEAKATDLLATAEAKGAAATDKLATAKLKEAKAETEAEKAKGQALKNDQLSQKLSVQKEVAQRKEQKLIDDLTNDYKQLSIAYNEAALRAKNYVLRLGENHPIAQAAVKDAKDLSDMLKRIDASVGQNTRSVGDYKSHWDGLGNSFNQLTRELPALAINANTFFLAISNNLPMFFDAIGNAQKEIKALKEEGKEAPSLFSRLSGAIFSWGTALNIGIALLTIFGGKIAEMVSKLFSASESFDLLATNFKNMNEVVAEGNKNAGKQIADLKILYAAAVNVNLSMEQRKEAVKKLKEEFPDYFKQIEDENILNGKAKDTYLELAAAIVATSRAAAAKAKIDALEAKRLDIDFQRQKIRTATKNERDRAKDTFVSSGIDAETVITTNNVLTKQQQIEVINQRERKALRDQDKEEANVNAQEKFLIAFVGEKNITKATIEEHKKREKAAKTETDNTYELLEAARKRLFEIEKRRQQDLINQQKALAENEALPILVRTEARKKQFEEEKKLFEMERDFALTEAGKEEANDIAQANKRIKNAKLKADTIKAIEEKAAAERELINFDYNEKVISAETSTITEILAIRAKAAQNEQADIDSVYAMVQRSNKVRVDAEVNANKKLLENRLDVLNTELYLELKANVDKFKLGEITKEEFERNKLKIENKYRVLSLKAEIQFYKDLLSIINLPEDERLANLKKLHELERRLNKETLDDTETTEKKKSEASEYYLNKRKELTKQLGSELQGLVFDVFKGQIEQEKNDNQERIDQLEERKQKEIEAENQKVQSAQDRAAAISVIEARAAAEKEQLERRQRQLNTERAKWERAQSVVNVIQNTAEGISRTIAEVQKFDGGIQTGILVALYAAIGAAQIARILATPLPKYEHGTFDHIGGKALVGEKRRELVIEPSGNMYITPNRPTILDLPKHTMVLPDADKAIEIFGLDTINRTISGLNSEKGINTYSYRESSLNKEVTNELRAIGKIILNKRETHITVSNPIEQWVRSGTSWFKRP